MAMLVTPDAGESNKDNTRFKLVTAKSGSLPSLSWPILNES
jgi:hypothetical protein